MASGVGLSAEVALNTRLCWMVGLRQVRKKGKQRSKAVQAYAGCHWLLLAVWPQA